MEIVDIDVVNEKGEWLSHEKINLPTNYDTFRKNKNHAFQFFIVNTKTMDMFEPQHVQEYQDVAQKYQFFRSSTVVTTMLVNVVVMRYIYANNLVYFWTQTPQVGKLAIFRMANKYYFIPQAVGIACDRLFFSKWFLKQTEKIYSKYDFQEDAFANAYQEMVDTKHTSVVKR